MTRTQGGDVRVARAVLFLLALAVAAPVAAQTGTEPRLWTAFSVQGTVGGNSAWRWSADSFLRTRNGAGTMDLVGESVSVRRDLTPRSSLGVAYAYGAGFPNTRSLREHRLVQQYTWSTGVAWRVSFRSRLEERFVTGYGAMLIRARQQVRVVWPLAARGALRGVVSEEVLVRANRTLSAVPGLDGNRVFVGIGRTVTPRSSIEIGYLNVYSAGTASHQRRSHVMSARLVVSL